MFFLSYIVIFSNKLYILVFPHSFMLLKRVNQRGQITIFVIVAIVIVLIAALFIIFRGSFVPTVGISKNIQPACT